MRVTRRRGWTLLAIPAVIGVTLAACERGTAERIVARTADAMGGSERIAALRTLRIRTIYPDHAHPVISEIRRPNLLRTEGVGEYVLVFDGERAAFLERAPAEDGTPRGPELVDPEYSRDFELDIAFAFPAFFDYPSEYLGREVVAGVETHKLVVELPLGVPVTYFIDAETYLPLKARADITVDGTEYHPERSYGDYRETDGFLYPRAFTYFWQPEDVNEATVEIVEVNVTLGDDRFAIPADLEERVRSSDARLPGGVPPGLEAAVFAPGLVSSAAHEFGFTVNQDWSEFYFTRLSGGQSVILTSRRTGETWSPATPAPFSGQYVDEHPWMVPGGDRLYFVSRRPCPGAQQALNVWLVERAAGGWTAPRSLGSPVTDQTVHAPSLGASGTMYASGLIQLRQAGGRYLPAERLTPDVSGSTPAVSPDEDFLVYGAQRSDGFGGHDLYVVFRQPDGSWGDPRNLGSTVNTEHVESSPTLSSDGRFLFFSRRQDIWWVDAAVIDAVRRGQQGS